jgi:hypothetical protein
MMKKQMNSRYKCLFAVVFTLLSMAFGSCKKENQQMTTGSISIDHKTDTLNYSVSTDKDTINTIEFKADVSGQTSNSTHTVYFKVDTTKLSGYTAKYGSATLLPSTSYLFVQSACSIPAGSSTSQPAQLNIFNGTSLQTGTTYVLPVIIQNVDGSTSPVAAGQVTYIIISTYSIYGTPLNKMNWKIVSFSSDFSAYGLGVANAIDNNTTTFWYAPNPMPQYATIDMGTAHPISYVTYFIAQVAASEGGYPLQTQIELSTDGVNWGKPQVFTGGTAATTVQLLKLAAVTSARYIRFTVIKAEPFIGTGSALLLAEIGANTP